MSTVALAFAHTPYGAAPSDSASCQQYCKPQCCESTTYAASNDETMSRDSEDVISNPSTASDSGYPAGTLHAKTLGDVVRFVPYPDAEFEMPTDAVIPAINAGDVAAGDDSELVRAFIGQLPYFVTDMQLAWLCYTFGAGNTVVFPERIMKRQQSGDRLPTGCVHAYGSRRAVAEMAEGMHKRLLIDDTGVWCAQTKDQLVALDAYVTAMKRDKALRVPHRPYDSVVVQFATSTFVPKHVAATKGLGNTTAKGAADVPVSAPARRQQRFTSGNGHHQQHQQQQSSSPYGSERRQYHRPQQQQQMQQPQYDSYEAQQQYDSYEAQQQTYSSYGAPSSSYHQQAPAQQQRYQQPQQQMQGGYAQQAQQYHEHAEPTEHYSAGQQQQQSWPNYHGAY